MRKEFSELINKLFSKSRDNGILQLVTQDEKLDGKHVTANGKKYLYFGSCSYLGLGVDERLKQGSMDATARYGTQFSCSRTFLELGLYEELEEMLGEIFGKPTLLAPTTSLAHVSTIPVIIGEADAVIADSQVHNSVRNAIQMVKGDGVYVETLPHNRMDMLETRIQILKQDHERVWYFADSVYSMYGDSAPMKDIQYLLNKYDQFHVYFDDAHGMSWTGKHGNGYVLQHMPFHPRMVLTSSLSKGFSNGGGVICFNDEEQKRFIRNCGSSFIFSGPLQPGVLGGCIAAAKIHLSDEITTLQDGLFENMFCFVEKAAELNIPVVSNELTPIFYIGTGKPEVGAKMFHYLMDRGIFCNHAMFPAVSVKNSGMRISLTRNHSIADINLLLETVAEAFPKILKEENYSLDEIYKDFNIEPRRKQGAAVVEESKKLKVA